LSEKHLTLYCGSQTTAESYWVLENHENNNVDVIQSDEDTWPEVVSIRSKKTRSENYMRALPSANCLKTVINDSG